jgi:hypothetical protein
VGNLKHWLRFGVAALLCAGCDNKSGASTKPTASAAPAPPVAPVETVGEHIDKLEFTDAVAYAKSKMDDTTNKDSEGAVLFAFWASKHMMWTDVGVPKDETTFALIRKDSDEERAKRLCTRGRIIQIEVRKLDGGGKLAEGLMNSDSGNLYNFIGAGSSGQLVQHSYARFCGVATGKYDYSNSGGGTGHAVEIVGMFDLPENRPTKIPAAGL